MPVQGRGCREHFIIYHANGISRRQATRFTASEEGLMQLIISTTACAAVQHRISLEKFGSFLLSFAPRVRHNNVAIILSLPRRSYHLHLEVQHHGAPAPLSLFLSHLLSSLLIVAQSGFFVGDFLKLRKFFCFFLAPRPCHAPRLLGTHPPWRRAPGAEAPAHGRHGDHFQIKKSGAGEVARGFLRFYRTVFRFLGATVFPFLPATVP